MSQRPTGAPGQEGQAGRQIGDSYSSQIPWVGIVRAIGSAIDFGGGGANRQQRQIFRQAGGTIVHKGKGRWQFTYNGQRISEKRAIAIAKQYRRGQLPSPVNPNAPIPNPNPYPYAIAVAGGGSIVDELELRRKAIEAAKKKAARKKIKRKIAKKVLTKAGRRALLARLGWLGWGAIIVDEVWDRFGKYVIPKPPPPIQLDPIKIKARRMAVPPAPRIERTVRELDDWRRHASSVPVGVGGVRVLRPGEAPRAQLDRVRVTARRMPTPAALPRAAAGPTPRVVRLPGGRTIAIPTLPPDFLKAVAAYGALRSLAAPRPAPAPLTVVQPQAVGSFGSAPVPQLLAQPATKPAKCKCKTRKKSSKPSCRNPRTSSRTYYRNGQKYRSTVRRIQCPA